MPDFRPWKKVTNFTRPTSRLDSKASVWPSIWPHIAGKCYYYNWVSQLKLIMLVLLNNSFVANIAMYLGTVAEKEVEIPHVATSSYPLSIAMYTSVVFYLIFICVF